MLALNKKTDYGLIALSCMAMYPERLVSARRIAQMYGMSRPLLMNVLKALCSEGLVLSFRGVNGGYRLARSAGEITLAQMVGAIQGAPRLVACVGSEGVEYDSGFKCDLADVCPVQSPVRKVHLQLLSFLDGITLADISGASFVDD